MGQEEIPEAVAGASKTADGKPLKGIVVQQNQTGVPATSKEDAKKKEFRTLENGKVVRRQPLATRHLDPNEVGSLTPDGQAVNLVNRQRYKVRNKYTFLYGEDLAYKGPVILWLTEDEVKGQEHKLEALEGGSVATHKDVTPPHVKENSSLEQLNKKLSQLLSEAEALKAEIWSQTKHNKDRARKEEIKSAAVRPPAPTVEAKRPAKTNPPPEPLEELVPGEPRTRRGGKLKLPPADEVDLTAPPQGNVSRPPAG